MGNKEERRQEDIKELGEKWETRDGVSGMTVILKVVTNQVGPASISLMNVASLLLGFKSWLKL